MTFEDFKANALIEEAREHAAYDRVAAAEKELADARANLRDLETKSRRFILNELREAGVEF